MHHHFLSFILTVSESFNVTNSGSLPRREINSLINEDCAAGKLNVYELCCFLIIFCICPGERYVRLCLSVFYLIIFTFQQIIKSKEKTVSFKQIA